MSKQNFFCNDGFEFLRENLMPVKLNFLSVGIQFYKLVSHIIV